MDIKEIKKRAEAASPGPWKTESAWSMPNVLVRTGPNVNDFLQADKHADNIFIAHARQDIPDLISEIESLREKLESAHHDEAVFGDHNLLPSVQAEAEMLKEKLALSEAAGASMRSALQKIIQPQENMSFFELAVMRYTIAADALDRLPGRKGEHGKS